MTNPTYQLTIDNLSLGFDAGDDHIRILKDVSLSLERGRMLAIVGESGCGKSMTAHSILRLLPDAARITSGQISLVTSSGETVEIAALPQHGKVLRSIRGGEIGMVFQDAMTALNPSHTVGRQTAESLRQHRGVSKEDAKAQVIELFRELGIPEPETRYGAYPHELSGGMRQRIMIAIAMINQPSILIADEPTTALDVTIQAQILTLIKRLQSEGDTSVILITHNMGVVAEYADDIAVMYMGRVVEVGPVHTVLRSPAHPYTQALVASVPRIDMDRDAPLTTIRGSTPNPTELGTGCEFADRCPVVLPQCRDGLIPLIALTPAHRARCVRVEGVSDS